MTALPAFRVHRLTKRHSLCSVHKTGHHRDLWNFRPLKTSSLVERSLGTDQDLATRVWGYIPLLHLTSWLHAHVTIPANSCMCDIVFVHMCVTVCEEPCEGGGGGRGGVEVGPLLQIGYLNVSCQINDTCTCTLK